jgi:hypothetical protein
MCPACIAGLALAVGGSASAGALAAVAGYCFGRPARDNRKNPESSNEEDRS